MKIDFKKALIIGLPIVILAIANYGVGKFGRAREAWYPAAIKTEAWKQAQYVMIGSSRVAASVAPDRTILNFGQGDSTTGEHLLGLQRMLDRDKDALRGKLVCIEAAGGAPEFALYDGGEWINAGSPNLIGKVISPADLPQVWRSNATAENKWQTTLRLYANKLALFRYKELVYGRFTEAGTKAVANLTWPHDETQSDLTSRGGIKTDPASIQGAMRYLDDYFKSAIAKEQPIDDWDDSCVAKIVQLVKANGGQVVFFETPLNSRFRAFYDRPIQKQNQIAFAEAASRWNTPILKPEITFTDEDFPDMWHLASTQAPSYTRALMIAIDGIPLNANRPATTPQSSR